jgi:hypothetical protein
MRSRGWLGIVLLACAVPAAAQSHSEIAGSAPSTQPIIVARLEAPAVPVLSYSRARDSFPESPSVLSARGNSLFALAAASETPFSHQVTVPMLGHPSGRFELGGFFSLSRMENVLWGLPGAGSLPAWTATPHSHPGVWAPYPEQSFGLSLKFHLHSNANLPARPPAWRCLGKLLRLGLS